VSLLLAGPLPDVTGHIVDDRDSNAATVRDRTSTAVAIDARKRDSSSAWATSLASSTSTPGPNTTVGAFAARYEASGAASKGRLSPPRTLLMAPPARRLACETQHECR
jgi:hypothetical protein